MKSEKTIIRAAGIIDAESVQARPGAILVEGNRILASGNPSEIGSVEDCKIIDLPDSLLIPAMVNAHSHLDLSHLGIREFPGTFRQWIDEIRANRVVSRNEIAESTSKGLQLSRAGGTAIIGDISGSGSTVPLETQRDMDFAGVSYLEVFGIGARQTDAVDRLHRAVINDEGDQSGVRLGLQPHAPYSCGEAVYHAAATLGRPLATHLAETLEEIEYIAHGRGPLADLQRELGASPDDIVAHGQHPVDWLSQTLSTNAMMVVHLNYVEPRHLDWLTCWETTVVYCPRASAYFGHPLEDFPPHPYQNMIHLGINVALGTDSLICLDTPDRISVLDEMRFLYQRDNADPRTLLRMATTAGARALNFNPQLVNLAPGPTSGILALNIESENPEDLLTQTLKHNDPPRWVWGPLSAKEMCD